MLLPVLILPHGLKKFDLDNRGVDAGMGIDVRRSYSRANSLDVMRASERVDRSRLIHESGALSPQSRQTVTKNLTTLLTLRAS